jgi:chromate transporter
VLLDLARLFLRLGVTAFGGPAAHVALMEEEFVRRRRWITREEFLDLLGASNLIPGPTSTELAMHIGLRRAGWPGLIVAGICFIAPAALIVGLLAAAYVRAGQLPMLEGVLRAVKPVALVIVLQALVGLTPTAVKSIPIALLAVAAAIVSVAGAPEIRVLLLAGLVHMAVGRSTAAAATALVTAVPASVLAAAATPVVPLAVLFGYFVKVGSVLFGSGYVLLAVLRGDLVERLQWLTDAQLLDAVAVGQVTPGPLFTTATFIGYLLGGAPGAVVGTVGIFLPAFVLTAASARLLDRLRRSPLARKFLDGVNAAAVALIAVVAWSLARHAIVDNVTVGIALVSAVLIGWLRINSAWAIGVAAVIGLVL